MSLSLPLPHPPTPPPSSPLRPALPAVYTIAFCVHYERFLSMCYSPCLNYERVKSWVGCVHVVVLRQRKHSSWRRSGRRGEGRRGLHGRLVIRGKARDLKKVFDKPPALTVVMCTNSDFLGLTNHCRELSLLSTGRLVSISSLAYDGWRNTCHLAMFT